ncbi:MAG: 7TM-DISM domain-containing protein [Burkholderiaceae bacterium]|nr:7TM-DISM domain-containing protein [Burkholderiaceae bacterium]
MFFALLDRPWLRWFALVGVLLWGCLAGAGPAQAQDHITERAWLEDPTGQLTLAEVRQRATQPFQETLNRGFGTAVLWLRLRIDPSPDRLAPAPPEGLVLRIRPVYLDEVVVFDPLVPGGQAGVVGDRHHPRQDVLQGADFLLPIARGDAPRDLWLRLQSTSTRQIHVAALPLDVLAPVTLRWNLLTSLYIGAVMVLLLWGTVNLVLRRDAVMGSFALMNLSAGLFGLTSLGFLRVFWPLAWSAEALNLLGSLSSVLVVGGGVLFHVRFLREFRPAVWAMGLLYAMLALVLVNLALLAWGRVSWALQSNMVTILLAPPICLVCAITGRVWAMAPDGTTEPALTRRVLVAFYLGFLTIFALSATTGLGWLPATEWTIYVSQLHTLVSSVLLMLMLQYRAFLLSQKRQQAQLALEKSTLQVAHERLMRTEQEKLLAMLAHEIKTPLATMQLRLDAQAKGGSAIRQAMRDMNGVIDRCLQTLQFGDGQLAPQLQRLDLVEAVRAAVSACSQPERVQVHLPASLPMQTDPQVLFIILSNLLENACKYSEPGTPIELHGSVLDAEPAQPVVRLELYNRPGKAGWPDPDHVFDKYYRGPKAQRQSGTGLGLYLVKSLAQTLGGRIAYQPDDQGVRFVLTLPLNPRA